MQIYTPTRDYDTDSCRSLSRLPSGHPEGFFESFGNLYKGFCTALLKKKYGEDRGDYPYPTIDVGIEGLKFVDACLKSSNSGNIWVSLD